MAQPLVELDNVHCAYSEGDQRHAVLRGVSASLQGGESLALVGRSGSGKSTLLNVVSGISRPDAGTIRVDGLDVNALGEPARTLLRRRRIGFVHQFFNLIDTLSVIDNVLLPLELNGRADAGGRARARAMLDEVGLGGREHAFPDRLSGGDQQRVALVRALVHDPALVLADEPPGNLDDETGGMVMEMLERMIRRAGHGLLLVTHSREIATRADRVLALVDGRLRVPD